MCAKYLGDQNSLCFFFEPDTYAVGSNVGTGQWIGLVQENSISESINVIPVRYQGAMTRDVSSFEDGQYEYTGNFSYFPQDWKFLGFALGSICDSTGTHTITANDSNDLIYAGSSASLTTFTLEDSKTLSTGSNFNRVIKGCMIDTYTIDWAQGEITSCSVDYIAQAGSFTSGARTSVTASTSKPHMYNNMTMVISGASIPVALGSLSNVKDASLSISNNLEPGEYLNGSRVPKEILPINRDIELSSTLHLDSINATYFYNNCYIGGSEFVVGIQSLSSAGSLFITLSGCKMMEMEVPSPLEGVHEQSMTINVKNISAIANDGITLYNAR